MRRTQRMLVLMMLTVPLLHCGGGVKEPPTSTLVLYDYSLSRPADITPRYRAAAADLLQNLKREGDRVTFAVIQVPVEFTEIKVNAELTYANDNEFAQDDHRDTLVAQTMRSVDSLLAMATRTKDSPLIDVFSVAAEYARSHPGYEHRLVVYTDGVHQTDGLDVADSVPAAGVINRLRGEGKIPNLSGVRVRVMLSIGGTYDTLPDEHRASIRQFWKSYIEAAGGTLEYYGA